MKEMTRMTSRSRLLAAVAVAAGLAAGAPTVHGWGDASRLTYLTFNVPVKLPGVALAAGSYAFDLADPLSANGVVRVRNRARTQLYFQGFTVRVPRPASLRGGSVVTVGGAAAGEPRPIAVWYPPDMSDGLQFVYRK